jgi:uncharacterized protein (TIGR02246 family)
MVPNISDIRAFAERYTAAWCSHDPALVASFYSPTGSLTINGGTPSEGRGAIALAAQEFFTAFPDIRVFLNNITFQDDTARFDWTFTGTNAGPSGSGNRVRISGYEVWRIGEDGLIADSQGHFDSEDYLAQIGRS